MYSPSAVFMLPVIYVKHTLYKYLFEIRNEVFYDLRVLFMKLMLIELHRYETNNKLIFSLKTNFLKIKV